MTAGRFHRWRLPLLLAGMCVLLAGILAWQLNAPAPQLGRSHTATKDDGGEHDGGQGDDAAADTSQPDAAAGESDEATDTATADDEDAFRLPPIETFSAIIERPLLNRSRRPTPTQADEAAGLSTSEGKSPLLLSGVMIAGKRRVALLQTRASPQTIRAEEGETIEGWKVVSIRPQAVTVASGSTREDLALPDRLIAPGTPVQTPPRQPVRPGGDPNRTANVPPPRPAPGQPTEQMPGDVDMESQ